mmetsp:Transcript_138086/g.385235  ORF Transcript_138086/g.385235 Transcript_138086/m.385235 type:complete len:1045 (+) Transcript_138086:117-3251(+)
MSTGEDAEASDGNSGPDALESGESCTGSASEADDHSSVASSETSKSVSARFGWDATAYWLLPVKPDPAAMKRWRKEVLDHLIVLCVTARLIENTCILFPLHFPKGMPSNLEWAMAVTETVTMLLTIRRPRTWHVVYVSTIVLHESFLFVAYWLPEVFGLQRKKNYKTAVELVQHIGRMLFLVPFWMPSYRCVPLFIGCFLTVESVALTILVCRRPFKGWDYALDACVACLFCTTMGLLSSWQRRYFEKAQQKGFMLRLKDIEVGKKMFHILLDMMPSFVVTDILKDPERACAQRVKRASILFVSISDFDKVSGKLSPEGLLAFLNEVFTEFDRICSEYSVTKIETIGEEYVCAVGVSPEDRAKDEARGHQDILGRLVQVASVILELQQWQEVQLKMGIHTGPVVAGVVGQKLPRFRLFGDTINTAARMMQKSLPGNVQLGEATYNELPRWAVDRVRPRGEVEMKGKGMVMTYLLPSCTVASPANMLRRMGSLPTRYSVVSAMVHARSIGTLADVLSLPVTNISTPGSSDHPEPSEDEFEQVLKRSNTLTLIKKGASKVKWCCYMHWAFIATKSQEGFLEWFWAKYVCKNVRSLGRKASTQSGVSGSEEGEADGPGTRGLDLHAFGLAALTLVEYFLLPGGFFAKRFLVCRGLCFLVVLWSRMVITCSTRSQPVRVTLLYMLGLRCAIVTLMAGSYWLQPGPDGCDHCLLQGLAGNVVHLSAIVVTAYLMTALQFLVLTACVSIVIPVGLITLIRQIANRSHLLDKRTDSLWFWFVVFAIVGVFRSILWECYLRREYDVENSMNEKKRCIEDMLDSLMPAEVIRELQLAPASAPPPSHPYRRATIAQSDLCGFTQLASTLQPEEVVGIICELFARFDNLADRYGIYKVETVGDAYIAGQAEAPLTSRNSPASVAAFGLGMIEETHQWSEERGFAINCRVGIHTGECVGGVVGMGMQRYHLFGRMMSSLEVLESTAPQGEAQISKACKEAIEHEVREDSDVDMAFLFQMREEPVLRTSKGVEYDYSEVGGCTFILRFDSPESDARV